MNFNTSQLGPNKNFKIIKIILALTAFFNILTAIIPQGHLLYLLGLSAEGLKQGFFWQILTNLFIITNTQISFGFVFHLAFTLYIIWIFGSAIIELKGHKHFISLLSVVCLMSSLFALMLLFLSHSSTLFLGGAIPLYVIALAWLMLHGDAKILLFFSLPFQAKWLILGIMGINFLSLLSEGSFIYLLVYLFTILLTYFISLVLWKPSSPFPFLKKFEKNILHFFKKFSKNKKKFHPSKIYDFKTGDPLSDDDEFMNAMLTKISLYGEDSLTKKERKRIEKISSKKKSNPQA